MEILQDFVQETAALHRDRPRLLGEARVVVVPVKPRALQIVVEGGRAEVIDLHMVRIAITAVGFERLAGVAIHDEADV